MGNGTLVVLKSGGPTMTVRVVSGKTAYCEWFTGMEHRQGTFDVASLQRINSAPDIEAQGA